VKRRDSNREMRAVRDEITERVKRLEEGVRSTIPVPPIEEP